MTTPTQMRLTDEDKARIEDLRRWYGLPSLAAAVRLAVASAHRAGPPAGAKKSRERARNPA